MTWHMNLVGASCAVAQHDLHQTNTNKVGLMYCYLLSVYLQVATKAAQASQALTTLQCCAQVWHAAQASTCTN